MFKQRKVTIIITAFISLLILLILSNEARKEVKYLCGNFGNGQSAVNVIRQLKTANLSSYEIQETGHYAEHKQLIRKGADKVIVFDNWLTLKQFSCIIHLNKNGNVINATLD